MNNQKGFALVLALVMLVVMSLMGGALIVVASGDHKTNNISDHYQQTFYVAETALIEGEKYLINQHLGPWGTSGSELGVRKKRDMLPSNQKTKFDGNMLLFKNYSAADKTDDWYIDTKKSCFNSFSGIKQDDFYVVTAQSGNFGILVDDSLMAYTPTLDEQKQIRKLYNYYYEFFITKGGSASFSGSGSSVAQGKTDSTTKGIAYKIYGCGIYGGADRMVVALESSVVLPRQ
tara:strand:- start:2468 stop:3163 length:696 start_codon:yes stop_codon:yes gene_type:complete